MLRPVRRIIRRSLRRFGYDICSSEERRDPFDDMKRLVSVSPVIFEIGANVGYGINKLRETFPNSNIHAFEPGRVAFTALKEIYGSYGDVALNNMALGSSKETKTFYENKEHDSSSFLETWPRSNAKCYHVEIDTLDDYCEAKRIEKIDIVRCQTEGFDLEVLNGAEHTIARGGIDLVHLEMNFGQSYKGLPPADEIIRFLRERRFSLVTFYEIYYINNLAGWTYGLFRYSN